MVGVGKRREEDNKQEGAGTQTEQGGENTQGNTEGQKEDEPPPAGNQP